MIYRLASLVIQFLEMAIVLSAVLSWFHIDGLYSLKKALDNIVSQSRTLFKNSFTDMSILEV